MQSGMTQTNGSPGFPGRFSFAEDIFTVDYDELVNSPEQVLRQLLHVLGFEWDDRCLTFQKADSLVKTASVWQVRDELHTDSSGRWRNYTPLRARHSGIIVVNLAAGNAIFYHLTDSTRPGYCTHLFHVKPPVCIT